MQFPPFFCNIRTMRGRFGNLFQSRLKHNSEEYLALIFLNHSTSETSPAFKKTFIHLNSDVLLAPLEIVVLAVTQYTPFQYCFSEA